MSGWIKLHRKVRDHWLYQEGRQFSRFEAWIDLIMKANHADAKILLGNELVPLERGQFITSELKLMEAWNWGKSKTRSFLELLENEEMITRKSDRKKTIITICNYSIYHDSEKESRPQTDHEQTSSGLSADTEKKNKELIKNKKKKDLCRKRVYDTDSSSYKLAVYFYKKICEWTDVVKEPNFQSWADDCRKLIELDKRDKGLIKEVIDWTTQDSFWQKNVMSPAKLRKQFDRLAVEVRGGGNVAKTNQQRHERAASGEAPKLEVISGWKRTKGNAEQHDRMRSMQ